MAQKSQAQDSMMQFLGYIYPEKFEWKGWGVFSRADVRRNITDDRYMDKTTLDNILEKHKAQPVGHGYIDIIVSRDNYKDFISDLVISGYKIDSVSWWEWYEDKKENKYGLGGPESFFYRGRFSEIPVNVDDFSFSTEVTKETVISEIVNRIETKTISFSNETVAFKTSNWLTPAIWIDVPDDWRNKHSA